MTRIKKQISFVGFVPFVVAGSVVRFLVPCHDFER